MGRKFNLIFVHPPLTLTRMTLALDTTPRVRARKSLAYPAENGAAMLILVANLGSTSFKYRLFRFSGGEEKILTKGGYENVQDYGPAIDACLATLHADGHLRGTSGLDGVGFKTVLGDQLTGCVLADERVEAALLAAVDLAPAHNLPYATGIRTFHDKLPEVPLVALFETAFYQWLPEYARRYAVPEAWYSAGVRRYGFHGASHKFVCNLQRGCTQ